MILTLVCAAAFAQQPRIDVITPSSGPIAGGTTVTIAGSGFAAATIRLDRETITPIARSDSEVRIAMPAHDNGYVAISAQNGPGIAYAECAKLLHSGKTIVARMPRRCATDIDG